jgi:quinol monooxygenase YgiN
MSTYGQFTTFNTRPGKADDLISLILRASDAMSSQDTCRLYAVGHDDHDPDSVRVFEIWESKADHDGSLHDPRANELIKQALPLLAGKPVGIELTLFDRLSDT